MEVLREFDSNDLEEAKRYIEEDRISISEKENIAEDLYIEVDCYAQDKNSKAVISGAHTFFSHIDRDEGVLLSRTFEKIDTDKDIIALKLKKVFDYAHESLNRRA